LTDCLFVETRGGVHVCVPRSISSMTSYALFEQEDWFEDEIRFEPSPLLAGRSDSHLNAAFWTGRA